MENLLLSKWCLLLLEFSMDFNSLMSSETSPPCLLSCNDTGHPSFPLECTKLIPSSVAVYLPWHVHLLFFFPFLFWSAPSHLLSLKCYFEYLGLLPTWSDSSLPSIKHWWVFPVAIMWKSLENCSSVFQEALPIFLKFCQKPCSFCQVVVICHKAGHWSENSEVLNSESGFLPSHPILRKCHCFSELLVFSTLTHRGVSGAEVFNSVLGFSEIETPMVLSINITEDKT